MANTVGATSMPGSAAAVNGMVKGMAKGMVQADSGSPRMAAALQARITQYQRQLADCLDCPSAKTPAGKRQIEELSHKISDGRLRIQALQASNSATMIVSGSAGTADGARQGTSGAGAAGLQPPQAAYSTLGSLIDVFG